MKPNETFVMQAVEDFLRYMAADRGASQRTLVTYRDSLQRLEDYFTALDTQLTWETLDADVVRRWMMHEMDRGQNARTVCKDLSAARSLYKYLLRMERIERDPLRLVKNPKQHAPLPTFLKQSEVDRLFDDVNFPETPEGLRDRTILLTFYHTGVRVSELTGLDMNSVHLENRELKVTGKRNKQRIIPFGEELAQALTLYMDGRRAETQNETVETADRKALFTGRKGQRITVPTVQNIVRRYLALVTTQKKKSPHVLRHTFATAMLNNGADLEAIKELLGHESISTTEVYTHTTFADLKKEYELAHPRA